MTDAPPRPLSRCAVEALLARLPGLTRIRGGRALSRIDGHLTRAFEVDLFCLIDPRPVRKVRRATLDTFPDEPWLCPNGERPSPGIREDWVSETHEFPMIIPDEDGSWTREIVRPGYDAPNGEWIEHPELYPVPSYAGRIEDALRFKWQVVFWALRLRTEETERGSNFQHCTTLLDGEVSAASYEADLLPLAIVGAVLTALLAGWTHELAPFVVVDE